MRILFIDTSNTDVSIAIIEDSKLLYNLTEHAPDGHSTHTVLFIEESLKKCNLTPDDINKILICNGPGSFTGIRIGLTIAKIYGYLKVIPLIPVSSLKARALSIEGDIILSIIDAKNDNYYIGLYDKNHNDLLGEHFGTKEEILEIINNNPGIKLVSSNGLIIDDYLFKKTDYDFLKISEYYDSFLPVNPHSLSSNYLKEPGIGANH